MTRDDLPNLFLIGAPKCGTTSVFRWLADHPQVCPSDPKETWYFAGEELDHLRIRPNHRRDGLDRYLACFEDPTPATRVKMEGSTHYLYSEPALDFLSSMDQKPRIIVQLRDPAVRIWSHYNYIKQRSQTPITLEFSQLVDRLLGTEGYSDEPLASGEWHDFLLKNQLNYSNYDMHLSKWMSRFPSENVFISTLEELAENKRSIAGQVADWVGVDASFYDDYVFATRNTTRTQEAESLRRQLAGYSRLFPRTFVRKVKAVVDKALSASRPEPRVADEESLARLRQHFHAANERLARKLGVDISRWQEPG